MPKYAILGRVSPLLFLTIQFTGCAASCPSDYVYLQAAVGVTKHFTSPNYPLDYASNENCKWRITAPEQYVVHLNVVDWVIEFHDNCSYDNLSIYNEGAFPPLATLCGIGSNSRHFYGIGQTMNVIFKSDAILNYKGFEVEYSAVRFADTSFSSTARPYKPCPSERVYLQAAYGSNRTLTSPNYPANYGNNENCKWRITAPEQYLVHLYVIDLLIEYSSECLFDNLSIYNEGSFFPLATLCGSRQSFQHFYSSRFTMDVIFKSDRSKTFRGFKLEYTAFRPAVVSTPPPHVVGVVANQYDSSYLEWTSSEVDRTHWRITCASSYVVELYVVQVIFQESCLDLKVIIYESDAYTQLGKLCGYTTRGRFISTGPEMHVQVIGRSAYSDNSFKLSYKAVTNGYTTSSPDTSSGSKFNYVLLTTGVVGFSMLITIICIVVRICGRRRQNSHFATAAVLSSAVPTSAPQRSGAAASQTNVNGSGGNGVYVVPDSRQQPAGGHSSLAFSEDFHQEPPSYFSLQPLPGPLPSASLPLPPSYSAAMMMMYPPVDYKADDDDGSQHILWGIPMGTPPPPSAPPPTYLFPTALSDHQESTTVVGSNPPAAPAGRSDEDAESTLAGSSGAAAGPPAGGESESQPPAQGCAGGQHRA